MKKLFMTTLTILACGAAYALPVGNPSDASLLCDGLIWEGHCGDPCDPCLTWCDAFSIRIGFYGDYVFNRHLAIDTNEDNSEIEHTQLFTNAASLAANFWDRFDVFATLGATNIDIDTNLSAFGNLSGVRCHLETEDHFSWSVGARGTIWECGCTTLGAEAQYFFTRPDIKRVTLGGVLSIYPDSMLDAKYREWQIGVGISHRINIFVPYVAVKWSHAQLDCDNARMYVRDFSGIVQDSGTVTLFDAANRKDWGIAVGVSLVDCEKASLTIEGRFADEKAVYVNSQLRF